MLAIPALFLSGRFFDSPRLHQFVKEVDCIAIDFFYFYDIIEYK